MPVRWFEVPYEHEDGPLGPNSARTIPMDRYNTDIWGDGGSWSEVEIDGDKMIIKVRASMATLNRIGSDPQMEMLQNRAAAESRMTATRRKPRYNPTTQQIEFSNAERVPLSSSLVEIDRKVPD